MRPVHWMFLLSVALFLAGIGFIIAGARMAQPARLASQGQTSELTPVASVSQIMEGIVGPSAKTIYDAVGTTMTASGTETWAPKTEAEWEAVGNSAAALVESANLIVMGSRAVDRGDWVKMSRAMLEGGKAALAAIEKKDADALFASGEPINASCDRCHAKYKRD